MDNAARLLIVTGFSIAAIPLATSILLSIALTIALNIAAGSWH